MKNIFLLLSFLTATISCYANLDVKLSQGYRRDRLSLDEVRYKKMELYMTHLSARYEMDSYFLRLQGAYGNLYDGKMKDTDYIYDHKKEHFSHPTHDITGSRNIDLALRFGKAFSPSDSFTISPMIGYGYYEQKIKTKSRHKHHEYDPFTGEKTSSHRKSNSYKAKWHSPQVGVRVDSPLGNFRPFVEYFFLYPLSLKGKSYWKDVHEDYHFRQKSSSDRSFGHIATVGSSYALTSQWSLLGELEMMKFYGKRGHEYLGSEKVSKLKKANRTSYEARISIGYAF